MNDIPSIISNKEYGEDSEFLPENLLREARRQKKLPKGNIPAICILDPDGDIVSYLRAINTLSLDPYWAGYHTQMYDFEYRGITFGIVGCAVGASFAVLVAEEMFASGCQLLISVTSAGQIKPAEKPPFFILITQALRDEGTSNHYLPPSEFACLSKDLLYLLTDSFANHSIPVHGGVTWTTDAPFRETRSAIDNAISKEVAAVEMEAAALYAFAQAKDKRIVCFAHVTNQMGKKEGDFEKGEADGSIEALELISTVAHAWLGRIKP
jgi:uridine phosphorylase